MKCQTPAGDARRDRLRFDGAWKLGWVACLERASTLTLLYTLGAPDRNALAATAKLSAAGEALSDTGWLAGEIM